CGGQKHRNERAIWSILTHWPLSKLAKAEVSQKNRSTSDLPYVNTQPNHNDLNAEREFNFGESIHFLNAFKTITSYVPTKDKNRIFKVDDRLMINPTLEQLLRSAE
ncbi:hypothetical protein AAFN46_20390, partial [Pseudomonas sp. CAU 1711]|uniref:hypothetical protein n=1 Tax=Pseudomonas sp. CAU 1711 TaxID=3140356 RepID=UPI00325FEC55